MREHFHCVREIFDLYSTKEQLEKLAEKPDIDLVCAYDYVKMKKNALEGVGLRYEDYHPELKGIKTIPTL